MVEYKMKNVQQCVLDSNETVFGVNLLMMWPESMTRT